MRNLYITRHSQILKKVDKHNVGYGSLFNIQLITSLKYLKNASFLLSIIFLQNEIVCNIFSRI